MTERLLAFVALGSNIGNRERYLEDARRAIAKLPETRLINETPVEETEAIGPVKQRNFLNQMIAIETSLGPEQLLERLQEIETGAGRVRDERRGPRTLDLDIVAIEGAEISSATLIVPHPELPKREFWLRELAFLRQSSRRRHN